MRVLKLWSLDQHYHHLGTCKERTFSDTLPRFAESEIWSWNSAICFNTASKFFSWTVKFKNLLSSCYIFTILLRVSQQQHYWHIGLDNSSLWRCCPVYHWTFSGILCFYPLDASSNSQAHPVMTIKTVYSNCQIPHRVGLRGERRAKFAPGYEPLPKEILQNVGEEYMGRLFFISISLKLRNYSTQPIISHIR